jgi:hypothetical protein
MVFQLRRMVARWVRTCGQANGSITITATTQRTNASANGDTWPTMARPITQLSDQKNAVRLSRR